MKVIVEISGNKSRVRIDHVDAVIEGEDKDLHKLITFRAYAGWTDRVYFLNDIIHIEVIP